MKKIKAASTLTELKALLHDFLDRNAIPSTEYRAFIHRVGTFIRQEHPELARELDLRARFDSQHDVLRFIDETIIPRMESGDRIKEAYANLAAIKSLALREQASAKQMLEYLQCLQTIGHITAERHSDITRLYKNILKRASKEALEFLIHTVQTINLRT